MPLNVSSATLSTAGVLLLAIVAVEWGGYHMLSLVRKHRTATPFQITFSRAGPQHAEASRAIEGVLGPWSKPNGPHDGAARAAERSRAPLATRASLVAGRRIYAGGEASDLG